MSDLFSRAVHWTAQQCGRASVFMRPINLLLGIACRVPSDVSASAKLALPTK